MTLRIVRCLKKGSPRSSLLLYLYCPGASGLSAPEPFRSTTLSWTACVPTSLRLTEIRCAFHHAHGVLVLKLHHDEGCCRLWFASLFVAELVPWHELGKTACHAMQSGYIDSAELAAVLRGMGFNPTDKRISEILDAYDTDGNGNLSFGEFVEVLFPFTRRCSTFCSVLATKQSTHCFPVVGILLP
jgi:EF-hand domain pair